MKEFIKKTDRTLDPLRAIADKAGAPLYDLSVRLFMATAIFLPSGWSKFENFLNGNWDSTVFLFEMEHPVPGIPAEIAAVMGTGGEVILSLLLIIGLFGRFAAAGLIVMTGVIQFTYMQDVQHVMWALLLASIFVRGPGPLSADFLLRKWIGGSERPKARIELGEVGA